MTKFKTWSGYTKSKGYGIMAMLSQLSLHWRVSFAKLTVGYKNVDDDSFLTRENLPIYQIR